MKIKKFTAYLNIATLILLAVFFTSCSGNYGLTFARPIDYITIPFYYIGSVFVISFMFHMIDGDVNEKEGQYKWYFLWAFIFTPPLYAVYKIFKLLFF